MALSVIGGEALNYYTGLYTIQKPRNKNSISFIKRMMDKLDTNMLKKSEELLILIDDTATQIQEKKFRSNINYNEIIDGLKPVIRQLKNLNGVLSYFEIDDPFIKKIMDTNNLLYSKMNGIVDLVSEYKEVNEARKEIKVGDTFDIDELLKELQD